MQRRLLLQYSALVLWLGPAQLSFGATVVAVRIWPAPDYTRITLESDAPLEAKVLQVGNPPRLALDIEGLQINPGLEEIRAKIQANDPFIRGIRVGQQENNVLRMVLDLKQEVDPQTFSLKPIEPYLHRLVFDLYARNPQDPLDLIAQQLSASNLAPSLPRKVVPAPASDDPLEAAVAQALSQSKASIVIGAAGNTDANPSAAQTGDAPKAKVSTLLNRLIIVAIDPGHGGEDPGAIGPRGTREKDVVLQISKRLEAKINKTRVKGVPMRAFLTRDDDYFVPLGQRVKKARQVQADLFISIHADAFTNPKARGASVFVLSRGGASSVTARWLAKKENNADAVGGVNTQNKDKKVVNALLDLSTSVQIKNSKQLGAVVLTGLDRIGNTHKKHVEQAGFAVLKSPDIPSILIETAFISNHEEEKLLRSSAYQKKLVDSIVHGIVAYLSQNPPLNRTRRLA